MTIGILSALPLILGLALWLWGAEEPGDGVLRDSREDSTGDDEGVALTARRAA